MKEIRRISQQDPRWSRKRLGNSVLTIGTNGCLLTDIASCTDLDPHELADLLEFTEDDNRYGGGKILWNKKNKEVLKKLGLKFVDRYRGWNPEFEIDVMKSKCRSKDPEFFVFAEVLRKDGGNHWLTVIDRSFTFRGIGWAMNNPWNAKREWKTVGWLAPFVRITGWLLFEKVKI